MGAFHHRYWNLLQDAGEGVIMSIYVIFMVGLFVTSLAGGGLYYTVQEFRSIGREPEKHLPGRYGFSEQGRKSRTAA
jgi:hypothetical protein